jgi:small subunit ribosomal protein S6
MPVLLGCRMVRRPARPQGDKMAFYESVLVFRQDLTEPQVKEKAAKFSEIIKELGGSIKSLEFWGLKGLAYIIRKNRKAHFIMLNVELPGDKIAELERRSRIDEDVIRFLNVNVKELAKGPSIMMKKNSDEVE